MWLAKDKDGAAFLYTEKPSKYKKLFVEKKDCWSSDLIDYNTGEIIG